ncbi:MAG: hypothetical protein M9959_01395 [Chitinophagaceae bacterium]|nr:hypothetical protein [Chitinophagaceae bacterium]
MQPESGRKKDTSNRQDQWGGNKRKTGTHSKKAENFGSHMTIDEKQIGKKMYTIMTRPNQGK